MFDFLKKWFGKKNDTSSADVDPLAAAVITTDTSDDKPLSDPSENSSADDAYDVDDADFDV
jgi:hypothetical protein